MFYLIIFYSEKILILFLFGLLVEYVDFDDFDDEYEIEEDWGFVRFCVGCLWVILIFD